MRKRAFTALMLALSACGAPDTATQADQVSPDEAKALNAAAEMLNDSAYPPSGDAPSAPAKAMSPSLPPAE